MFVLSESRAAIVGTVRRSGYPVLALSCLQVVRALEKAHNNRRCPPEIASPAGPNTAC